MTPDEAFKLVDSDFDGIITSSDISKFLNQILNIQRCELSTIRVNRLIKLMDTWKRGKVLASDFKRIIIGNNEDATNE